MNPLRHSAKQIPAFTLIELLCTVAIIAILAALLLPVIGRGYGRAKRAVCSNNLKQTGVAMSAWAHDHNDLFPMQVSTNQQGTLEIARAASLRSDVSETYRHFQALSNELITAKVLACPADRQRIAATNFPSLRNDNVSYWINPGAVFGRTDSPVAGDRNVRTSGRMEWAFIQFGAGDVVEFSADLHGHRGNVLFGDAHVEDIDGRTFRAMFTGSNSADMVLSLPEREAPADETGTSTKADPHETASFPQGHPPDSENATNPSAKSTGNSNSPSSLPFSSRQARDTGRQMAPEKEVIIIARLDGTFTTSSIPKAVASGVAESRGSLQQAEATNPLLEFIQWLTHQSARGTYWLLLALLIALVTFEMARRRKRRKTGGDRQ